jgi:hypothetical protein
MTSDVKLSAPATPIRNHTAAVPVADLIPLEEYAATGRDFGPPPPFRKRSGILEHIGGAAFTTAATSH